MNKDELKEFATQFSIAAGHNYEGGDSYELTSESHVIDVGGWMGHFSAYLVEKYDCYVDIYEPVKILYNDLVSRFASRPKVRVFNYGLEASDGQVDITITGHSGDGSNLYGYDPAAEELAEELAEKERERKALDAKCTVVETPIDDAPAEFNPPVLAPRPHRDWNDVCLRARYYMEAANAAGRYLEQCSAIAGYWANKASDAATRAKIAAAVKPLVLPTVKIRDVSSVIRERGTVDFMVLNAEGSEYNILSRLLTTCQIRQVKILKVQFHDFYPDAENLRNAIREQLRETHTEIFCCPFVWETWRRKD